jgi:hypothetical protein
MTATLTRSAVHVREAHAGDNASLLALATACPMEGDIALAISREPDFFALNRLEGTRWRAAVAEIDGRVVGCIMAAARTTFIHGQPRQTLYAGDLKVHPTFRGIGVADALTEWGIGTLLDLGEPDSTTLITILGGNRAMERRATGRGGAAAFTHFATIRAFSIPLLWPRRPRAAASVRVSTATSADLEEMVALWKRVAPGRQFAPVFDAADLDAWISGAPGLSIGDYRVARTRDGRVAGFLAWWDQAEFKQSRVLRYSSRLALARAGLNWLAFLTQGVRLPPVGASLRYLTALHVCVPSESPEVLGALLRTSCPELRAEEYAFATIGLDVQDPLSAALAGLAAQPTDVNAYVMTPTARYAGPSLADRPLHYEIALV